MADTRDDEYWFNTRTGKVERGKQSLATDRLGPFPTAAEAARANEKLAENARKWAEEEARAEEEDR